MGISSHSSHSNQSDDSSPKHPDYVIGEENIKSPFKNIDSEDFAELYDTKKLALGIQRHLTLIVGCMLTFGIIGAYISYVFQTTYQAEALVLYQEEQEASKSIEGGFILRNLSLPTTLDMIKMPKHFEAIKSTLGLDLDPKEISAMAYVPKPKNNSNLIRIVAKTKNPNLSIDIANALATISVKSSQEFTKKQLKMALDSYEEQLSAVKRSVVSQINEMERYKLENQYFDMKPEESSFLTKVEEARKLKDKASVEYNSLLAQYENLKEEAENIPKYVPISMESKDSPLQMRIISLETTLASARAKYTKENPKLLLLEQELDSLQRSSKQEMLSESDEKFYEKNELKDKLQLELMHLQAKVRSAQKVNEEVSANFKILEEELVIFPVHQMALVKLLQSNELGKEQLKDMNKAVDSAKLMLNIPRGSIELYQLAYEAKPWKDALWVELIPILGLIFGLGLGIAGSIILEIKDTKIRTAKQVEMYYNLPCIGSIPELSDVSPATANRRLIFFIRNLVEHIDKALHKNVNNDNAMIAITSSIKNEGKSLIANLAAGYYSKLQKKVLLLEMDYNHSQKNNTITSSTISDYLKNKAALDDIISKGEYDRITLTEKEPAMKELLKSKAAAQLWRYLKTKYELVIIDTPGIIEEDYTANLTEISDLSILIVGSSKVDKSTVDESLKVLNFSGSKICGILLNRISNVYISDKRILLETKKSQRTILSKLFS